MDHQVTMGLLIAISLGLAGWALKAVVSLSSAFEAAKAVSEERKEENNRRFEEIKSDNDRRFIQVTKDCDDHYNELKADVSKIDNSVVALHKRLDGWFNHNSKGG